MSKSVEEQQRLSDSSGSPNEDHEREGPGTGARTTEGSPKKGKENNRKNESKPTVKISCESVPILTSKTSRGKMTRPNPNPNSSSDHEGTTHHEGVHNLDNDSKIPKKYLQISEENQVLKRQLRKQEERMKILATKLIRVISERSSKTKREEILLEEQKARISDLEQEVSSLREKLQLSKQQLSSYTKMIPHHHHHLPHPPSRQASMLSSSTGTSHSKLKKPGSARSTSAGGSQGPGPSMTTSSSRGNLLVDKNFTDKVEELLLEAKAENQALEDQLKHCRQRLASTEEELEKLKEVMEKQVAEHQEEIMKVKASLGKEQDLTKKKKQLSDNIQLIRLQRESRRTASWLSTLEAQCRALESNLQNAQETVQQLEGQLSDCQEELGQEQQKNINLQKQIEDATNALSRLKELEAQIEAIQEENKILKETNESLLKKAFNVSEKVEKAESQEMHMKVQMSHLETVLKAEMKSKNDLQQSLRVEKEKCGRLESTNEKLQEALDKLNEEMKSYKRPGPEQIGTRSPLPSSDGEKADIVCFLSESEGSCVHQTKATELEKELSHLRNQFEIVKDELGRTKSLMRSQATANKEYQREIEELTLRLDRSDEFHHRKLQGFVKVLEERTRQIASLEKCMDEWKAKQNQSGSCPKCGDIWSRSPPEKDAPHPHQLETLTKTTMEAVTGDDDVEQVVSYKESEEAGPLHFQGEEEQEDEDEWEDMKEKKNDDSSRGVDLNANVNTQED